MSTDRREHTCGHNAWRAGAVLALTLLSTAMSGCYAQQMADQQRLDPLEKTDLFADSRASRPLIGGTVARGHLHDDEQLFTGKVDGKPAETFPFAVDLAVLQRGRERYEIFCTPCHDRVGTGNGIVVQRGFRKPPSFHIDRLRHAPVGHLFDVMTNGFGAMSSYASQVPVRDRWAIAAYIRALQLSQFATPEDLSPSDLEQLGGR